MPHDQCPPSHRGHAWREVTASDLSRGEKIDLALRVCKRCGKLGRVSKQGVIHVVGTRAARLEA